MRRLISILLTLTILGVVLVRAQDPAQNEGALDESHPVIGEKHLQLDPAEEAQVLAGLNKLTSDMRTFAGLDAEDADPMRELKEEVKADSSSDPSTQEKKDEDAVEHEEDREMEEMSTASSSSGSSSSSSSSRTNIAACNTSSHFFFGYLHVIGECQTANLYTMLNSLDWRNFALANAAFQNLCKSKCASALAGLLAHKDSSICLSGGFVTNARVLGAICTDAPANATHGGGGWAEKDTCGAHIAVSGVNTQYDQCNRGAASNNKTRCHEDPKCYWDQQNRWYGRCALRPTTELLDRHCSPCMRLLTSALGQTATNAHMNKCAKIHGRFCLPAVVDEMYRTEVDTLRTDWQTKWAGLNQSMRAPLCQSEWTRQCVVQWNLRKFVIPRFGSASTALRSCIASADYYARFSSLYYRTLRANRREACMRTYQSSVLTAEASGAFWANYCQTGGPSNNYCGAMTANPPADNCLSGTQRWLRDENPSVSSYCNSTCAPLVKETIDAWGCCFKAFDPKMNRQFVSDEFPITSINATQIHTYTEKTGGYNLTKVRACSSEVHASIDSAFDQSCGPAPTVNTFNFSFDLVMNLTRFEAAETTFRPVLIDALKQDLAAMMGVMPGDLSVPPAALVPATEPPRDASIDLNIRVDSICNRPDGAKEVCFGYTNPTSQILTVERLTTQNHPDGLNYLEPKATFENVTTPIEFLPGTHVCAFTVPFGQSVRWHLISPNGEEKQAHADQGAASGTCTTGTNSPGTRRQFIPTPPDSGPRTPPSTPTTPGGIGGGGSVPPSASTTVIILTKTTVCSTRTSKSVCFGYYNPTDSPITVSDSSRNYLEPKGKFKSVELPTVFLPGRHTCVLKLNFNGWVRWHLTTAIERQVHADQGEARRSCTYTKAQLTNYYRMTFVYTGSHANFTETAQKNIQWRMKTDTMDFSRTNAAMISYCPLCRVGTDIVRRMATDSEMFKNAWAEPDRCWNDELLEIFHNAGVQCEVLHHQYVSNATYRTNYSLSVRQAVRQLRCNSACFDGYKALRTGRTASCLPASIRRSLNVEIAKCSKDKDGTYCGAYFDRAGYELDRCRFYSSSSTRCRSRAGCRYIYKTRQCIENPKESMLRSVCNSKCIPRLAATLAGDRMDLSPDVKAVVDMETITCTKDGAGTGPYCLEVVADELADIQENSGYYTTATLDSLCNNGTKRRCFRRLKMGETATQLREAEDAFITCVEGFSSTSHCYTALTAKLQSIHETTEIVNNMCNMNNNLTHPTYCLHFPLKYLNSTCLRDTARKSSSYNTGSCRYSTRDGWRYTWHNCVSELEGIVHDMGCCLGTLQQIYGHRPVSLYSSSYDTPKFTRLAYYGPGRYSAGENATAAPPTPIPPPTPEPTAQPPTPQPTEAPTLAPAGPGEMLHLVPRLYYLRNIERSCQPYSNNYSNLEAIPTRVHYCCNISRSNVRATRTLTLGATWSEFKSSTRAVQRTVGHLRRDLANKLGLSMADFIRMDIRSSRPRATTAGGTARRQTQEEEDAANAEVEFEIDAENSDDTTNATAQYTQLSEDGELTLPSTTASVANECDNCTAAGFQTSAESVNVEDASSGATVASTPATAVAVLSIILSLMFAL